MTKKHTTKRALLLSVMSMLLCITMLMGTTFAWFTDTATSAGNKIVAGKLDVQLLMDTGSGYTDISDSTTPIFGAGSIAQNNNAETLWEPGKTQVAYLAIKNNGTLALKYKVTLNAYDETNNLHEVMEYVITPGAQYGSLDAWDGTEAKSVEVGTQTISNGEGTMQSGDTHYFALSIHMDEEAGNTYQGGTISFDITVLATQLASESDSFGDQYDVNANYELHQDTDGAYLILDAADLMAFNAWMNEAGFNGEGRGPYVKLMADIDMTGYDWLSINEMFMTFDGNGHTISNLNCVENGSKSGFFGYLGGATIKNLTLENVTSVGSQAGIFAGQSEGSKIINCNIAGTNYVAWDNDSGDAITKNGIGAYVGVSVDAFEVSGTIEEGTEITMNTNGMTGGWDNVDTYAGGLYNSPQTIDVNDLGTITTLTYVSDGLSTDAGGNFYVSNAAGLEALHAWYTDETDASYNMRKAFWGKTYSLMADIDANGYTWTTIKTNMDSATSNGITFNGNGHTISNMTIDGNGMFTGATQGSNAGTDITVIKDLTLDNVTVNGGTHHNGVVWGEVIGSITLENVNVINSKVSGGCNVGGLVGRNSESHATIKFVDCSVKNTTVEATKVADYAGASAFLGNALHIGTSCSANVVFEGTNVAEGNTLTTAEGMQGGGIYTIAEWDTATWATPTVVDAFTNYNSAN